MSAAVVRGHDAARIVAEVAGRAGGGEEQKQWRTPYHPKKQRGEDRDQAEGVGCMNGKDPVRAFVCRRRFLATQATAELRASLLSLSPHLMGWDRRGEEEQKEVIK